MKVKVLVFLVVALMVSLAFAREVSGTQKEEVDKEVVETAEETFQPDQGGSGGGGPGGGGYGGGGCRYRRCCGGYGRYGCRNWCCATDKEVAAVEETFQPDQGGSGGGGPGGGGGGCRYRRCCGGYGRYGCRRWCCGAETEVEPAGYGGGGYPGGGYPGGSYRCTFGCCGGWSGPNCKCCASAAEAKAFIETQAQAETNN